MEDAIVQLVGDDPMLRLLALVLIGDKVWWHAKRLRDKSKDGDDDGPSYGSRASMVAASERAIKHVKDARADIGNLAAAQALHIEATKTLAERAGDIDRRTQRIENDTEVIRSLTTDRH